MSYFRSCNICGANLDPGEVCGCKSLTEQNKRKFEKLTTVAKNGQLKIGGICEYSKNKNKESFWD